MIERKDGKAKGAKFHAEGPKPKVPHLDLPPELGNEDHHAIPRRQSGSHPFMPLLDLGRHDISLTTLDRDLR